MLANWKLMDENSSSVLLTLSLLNNYCRNSGLPEITYEGICSYIVKAVWAEIALRQCSWNASVDLLAVRRLWRNPDFIYKSFPSTVRKNDGTDLGGDFYCNHGEMFQLVRRDHSHINVLPNEVSNKCSNSSVPSRLPVLPGDSWPMRGLQRPQSSSPSWPLPVRLSGGVLRWRPSVCR